MLKQLNLRDTRPGQVEPPEATCVDRFMTWKEVEKRWMEVVRILQEDLDMAIPEPSDALDSALSIR